MTIVGGCRSGLGARERVRAGSSSSATPHPPCQVPVRGDERSTDGRGTPTAEGRHPTLAAFRSTYDINGQGGATNASPGRPPQQSHSQRAPEAAMAQSNPLSPIPEPQWCDCSRHFENATDVEHMSTPITMTFGDEEWAFHLGQCVERAFPDEPGEVHLRVDVVNTAILDRDAQLNFPVAFIPQLCERLMTEHGRAKFLGVPALSDVVRRVA